jgi:hypothetical protein
VEGLVPDTQAAGDFPGDVGLELAAGLPVGQPFQSLQHHDRGDHVGRHRGPAPIGGEQIGEHVIREQLLAVLGQEGVHRTLLDEMAAERGGIDELAVRPGRTLHPGILLDPGRNREF